MLKKRIFIETIANMFSSRVVLVFPGLIKINRYIGLVKIRLRVCTTLWICNCRKQPRFSNSCQSTVLKSTGQIPSATVISGSEQANNQWSRRSREEKTKARTTKQNIGWNPRGRRKRCKTKKTWCRDIKQSKLT